MSEWVSVGENLVSGFIRGVGNKAEELKNTVANLINSLPATARKLLGIHSPSKVFAEIGGYTIAGFVSGIVSKSSDAMGTIKSIGTQATSTMNKAIAQITDSMNSNMTLQPVITPILDLSNINSDSLNSLFSTNRALSVNADMNNTKSTQGIQNDAGGQSSTNTSVNFVQNNYSPKALSREDIYRQTKNQFSAFERAVLT